MSGQLYILSGPSGAGKSTIIRLIIERVKGLGYSVSHTSRAPRSDEVNGVDYHFVDKESFTRMIKENAFVEWANVYQDLYGTSLSELNNLMDKNLDVILDLDSQGAKNVKEHFKESVLIYILPPSIEALEKRLRERAMDNEDVIDSRSKKVYNEIKECVWYDYIIVNDDIENAIGKAESIIISDRCRNARMLSKINEILDQ